METRRIPDVNGWLEVKDNPLSCVGVYQYSGRFISPDLPQDQLYKVLRPADELASSECIASFRLVPWTNDHPSALLGDGENKVRPEDKGIEGVTGENIWFDDEAGILKGNIKVFTAAHADRISDGKEQLSLGYQCSYEYAPGVWNGQPYDYVQRNIRGNHVASVDDGRMGPEVAVLDGLIFTIDSREFTPMKRKNKLRSSMNALIRYARDAEETATEPQDKSEIAALMELLKKVAPLMEQLSKLPAVEKAAELTEEGEPDGDEASDPLAMAAQDAEKEEGKEPPKEDKKEEGKGMDSKETIAQIVGDTMRKIAPDLFKEQKPTFDAAEFRKEEAKKSRLADNLSHFTGVFDASEMSLAQVAEYGVKKLNIPCQPGTELALLEGYLHGRQPERPSKGTGFDRQDTGDDFIDKQLKEVK